MLTEVDEVGDGVQDAVDEDEPAGHLVEVDVFVERQERAQTVGSRQSDEISQHHSHDERTVEVQHVTCRKTRTSSFERALSSLR